jgi:hypothetical protein
MLIQAHLYAFGNGEVRPINVPDKEWVGTIEEKLERVFYWGQNDFQPLKFPSLSVGDVVKVEGRNFLVKTCGFGELTEGELAKWVATPRRERSFPWVVEKQ